MQKIGNCTDTANADGEFTDGDPQTQTSCTWVMAAWLNTLQRELVHLCEEAGLTLDPSDDTQVYQAISELLSTGTEGMVKSVNNQSPDKHGNVKLGTAANADVTTSATDTTSKRVLKVGDYGMGVANGTASLASIYDITCSGLYAALGSGTDTPTTGVPADSGNTKFVVYAGNIYSNQYLVTLTSNIYFYVGLVNTASKTATWSRFYNTLNKPTANDVSAIPVEVVGVINDNMKISSANKTGWWRVAVSNTATISDFPTFPGGEKLYGYGYLFVDLSSGSWLQHYYSHRGQNAKRQDWNGPVPTPDTLWVVDYNTVYKPGAGDVGAYTKGESDNRFQPKGNYTPAGEAYTKAQSDLRYVQGIRLSATQVRNFSSNRSSDDGALASSITMVGGSSNTGALYVRYVQQNINGTFVNVAVLN